jgi:hypothetical protein
MTYSVFFGVAKAKFNLRSFRPLLNYNAVPLGHGDSIQSFFYDLETELGTQAGFS